MNTRRIRLGALALLFSMALVSSSCVAPVTDAMEEYNAGVDAGARGDLDEAIRLYTRAIKAGTLAAPDQAAAHNNRGNAHNLKRQYKLALADYDTAIRLNPDYAAAYNNRGNAHEDLGHLDLAIADYSKAIALDPADPSAYNNRAFAYWEKRLAVRGLRDSNRALRLDRNYAEAYDTRARLHEMLGWRRKAIADYRAALALDPTIESARAGLKRLGAAPEGS